MMIRHLASWLSHLSDAQFLIFTIVVMLGLAGVAALLIRSILGSLPDIVDRNEDPHR